MIQHVLQLPRLHRTVLVIFFTLTITLFLFPLVDQIYIEHFFNEDTLILPALVSVSAGFVAYLIGWTLIIQQYEIYKKRPELPVRLYLLICLLIIVLDIYLIGRGLIIAS